MRRATLTLGVGLLLALAASIPLRGDTKPGLQPLKMPDILAWKGARGAALSHDGQWLAYRLSPNEGDSELILRRTQSDKEQRFPVGESRGFGGDMVFSDDSKWLAFTINPPTRKPGQPQAARRPSSKLALMNLASGEKVELEGVRRFVFSGEAANWIALHKSPPEGAGAPSTSPGERTPGPFTPSAVAAERPTGTDLILRELATGTELNVGNVSEFSFDKKGQWLAYVVDAAGQSGNGIYLRHMATSAVTLLDGGKASYRGLNWTEKGEALAVLKGIEDKQYEGRLYSVLGFTDFTARVPQKVVFDPQKDKDFPAGMTVSPNRGATWTEDLSALLFGIQEVKKKETKPPAKEEKKPDGKGENSDGEEFQPPRQPPTSTSAGDADRDKPDLVIWHWSDERLQSQQQLQAAMDRSYSYLCTYRVKEKKFLRLADDTLRQVSAAPKQRWAIGLDDKPYELMSTLDGRRYQDVYVIDMHTGAKRLALKKSRWYFGTSPDGTHLLYYDDCHYYTHDLATGKTYNITKDTAACFVNEENDHNIAKPPVPPVGWAKDGVSVLLSDRWDVWSLPVHGGPGVNLTVDGKKDGIRYRRRFVLDRQERGIDLAGRAYFSVYGEWTKKAGIACVEGGKPGARRLLWGDAEFGALMKAKDADVYLFTRETWKDCPDYYVSDYSLKDARWLTDANPQQEKFAWSKGSMLVDYTSAKGQKLQAALFLPADYEEGKRYPTIVYIYEKLSNGLNRYYTPTASGFNKSDYTSNGYAVLMPDIVYQVNDPGRSAVWCVLPALEAAIATGVVDRERVAIHGHSWGGYQTSFLITQTDAFKAAVAGAPLTNLISMYSSIYWNTGSANQPIFESSQGRFTSGYWDDVEAYTRNSPVYYAKNVKTPLLLLHNDRDGAVDWNQGIEYFNTLRRLRKPVVMLQYKGENHGLAKPANQKDYMVRMMEFFDHHLRDKPAPGWWKDGVPHLKLEDHLKERATEKKD